MMSIVTGKEDGYLSGLSPITQYIQSVMHREKSGQGGRKKAEEERKAKLETIKLFLDELKQVRFTGQFKTCRRAVDVLLARDERFLSLADNIENGKISYDNFLIPEAKKIWNRTIRLDRPK
jgi:hypothetical protein